jgi:transposase InsO family protein
VIVDYIDTQRGRFGVESVCAVLAQAGIQIAPSTYYARSKAPLTEAELCGAYLANQLRSLWQTNWGVYGARKLWHTSRRAGLQVGRDQVARLMRIAGITGTIRGKHRTVTTRRDETVARHPDLVRRGWAAPTRVDQLWVADFSYVWTLAGFVYVAFVVDVFSRRILGWRVTITKHTGMVTDALHQALQVRRRGDHDWVTAGLIHHSDAGSQYVSVAFTAELIDAGIAGSIGTVGDALGQRAVRVDHRAVQNRSDLAGPAWRDRRDVEWQVARWVHWYNTSRLHSSIGHLPPIEFEQHHRQARTTTPNREVA